MSLNIKSVTLTPSTVYSKGLFVITAEVYDDAFEFTTSHTEYNEHQGFADIEQTIGGELQ